MSAREKIVKSLRRDIERTESMIKSLEQCPLEEIEAAFPDAHFATGLCNDVRVCFPMNWALVSGVKAWVAERYPSWVVNYDRQIVWDDQNRAGYFVDYKLPESTCVVCFEFRTEREGSTCVLHEIGKKTVPVYEITCVEGAAEPLQQTGLTES